MEHKKGIRRLLVFRLTLLGVGVVFLGVLLFIAIKKMPSKEVLAVPGTLLIPSTSQTFTTTTMNVTNLTIGGVGVTASAEELNYVKNVTSAIQTQMNLKAPKASPTFTGSVIMPGTGIWDSSGNIGIGTTSPQKKLDIVAPNSTINNTSGNISIVPAANLLITQGNVGIGTTGPTHKLHVEGSIISRSATTPALGLYTDSASGTEDGFDFISGANLSIREVVAGTATTRLYIQQSGNVGIGTTGPGYKLDVSGTVRFTDGSNNVNFYQSSAGAGELRFVSWTTGWNINEMTADKNLYLNRDSPTTSDVYIGNYTRELVVKGATGNVGIGTTAPTGLLQVADIYAAGGKNLVIGDDAYLSDVDVANTLGIYSVSNSTIGAVKLGSSGPTLTGNADGTLTSSGTINGYAKSQEGSRYTTDFNSILSTGFFNAEGTPANAPNQYGQLIAARGIDTGLQIYGGYISDNLYFRGWWSSGGGFSAWRTVIHSGNIGSQNVNNAQSANYLPPSYIGGVQTNPQVYFNNGIGLKVAMTGYPNTWSDTLWINGYSGGDVPWMIALHTIRNSQPRMWISAQTHTSTSFGTAYEFITSWNIASQTVSNSNMTDGYHLNQAVTNGASPTFGWTTFTAPSQTGITINAGTGITINPTNYGIYVNSGASVTGVHSSGNTNDFMAAGPGIDYATGSSIRWKRDLQPMDNALDKVLAMRGLYYTWDEEHGGKHDMGMIAEEVGKVVPEIVGWDPDAPGYAIGMDYGHLTPILVEAIKEQQKQIVSLQSITTDFISKFKEGLIETKKLIVDGVDILKKLNELSDKSDKQQKTIDSQQKQIDSLQKIVEEMKKK